MKGINLAVTFVKHVWVLKNVITGSGLKIKVYRKRNISQMTKIILKRNDFIVIKTIDGTSYRRASFVCLENSFLELAKSFSQ